MNRMFVASLGILKGKKWGEEGEDGERRGKNEGQGERCERQRECHWMLH